MVFRLIRRLMGLTVSLVLVLGVTSVGTQLAARSMTDYVRVVDQAQVGNYAQADSISAQLARDWRRLGTQVSTAWASLEKSVSRALAKL
mgnify:CR=1 FL=1|jgi:hypothetical protein